MIIIKVLHKTNRPSALKAFTLIEILVATYIFMVVIMMVTSSFAMIKKSNDNSDDTRIVNNCAKQVEETLQSLVKSSSFGSPTLMGILRTDDVYTLKKVDEVSSSLDGFATFEDPLSSDVSQVRIKTFYKKPEEIADRGTVYSYYYSTAVVSLKTSANLNADPSKSIPDGWDVSNIVNSSSAQRINPSDCSANSLDTAGRFVITASAGGGSNSGNLFYVVKLQDKFFRYFADQKTEKIFSNVNVEVGNDAKSF